MAETPVFENCSKSDNIYFKQLSGSFFAVYYKALISSGSMPFFLSAERG